MSSDLTMDELRLDMARQREIWMQKINSSQQGVWINDPGRTLGNFGTMPIVNPCVEIPLPTEQDILNSCKYED